MSAKEKWLWTYKVVRSVLFTAILFIGALFVGLYVVLSLPGVQSFVGNETERELSALLGSKVKIGDVNIKPFNEVIVSDVDVWTPDSASRCLHIEKLGAGISVWNLIANRRIVITYAELIGMDADIRQHRKDGPLNIDFIIDAFAPKDKNRPPAKFDLEIRNIVVRKSSVGFNRDWMPATGEGRIDFNHLKLSALNADVALPRLSNDLIEIDLRRLALRLDSLFEIKRLACFATIDRGDLQLRDFILQLPNSSISINDQEIPLSRYDGDFRKMLSDCVFNVNLDSPSLIPSELAGFYPPLRNLTSPTSLSVMAKGNAGKIALNKLSLQNETEDVQLEISDSYAEAGERTFSEIILGQFRLHLGRDGLRTVANILPEKVTANLRRMIADAGVLDLSVRGRGSVENKDAEGLVDLRTGYGDLMVDGRIDKRVNLLDIKAKAVTGGFNIGVLLDNPNLGMVACSVDGEVALDPEFAKRGRATGMETIDRINMMLPAGNLLVDVGRLDFRGFEFNDINVNLRKTTDETNLSVTSGDADYDFSIQGDIIPDGTRTESILHADINRLYPAIFLTKGKLAGYTFSGNLDFDLTGNTPDNLFGTINFSDILAESPAEGSPSLRLSRLLVEASRNLADDSRRYDVSSDWFSAVVNGSFTPTKLPAVIKGLLSGLTRSAHRDRVGNAPGTPTELSYDFRLYPGGSWMDFFKLPVNLLYEAEIRGDISSDKELLTLDFTAPYIQQGRDKLIQRTALSGRIENGEGKVDIFSSIPTKKGVLDLDVGLKALDGTFNLDLGFNREKKGAFYGDMGLSGEVMGDIGKGAVSLLAKMEPSVLYLNDADWQIGEAEIRYNPGQVTVSDFSIRHADQFVTISGEATDSPDSELNVVLNDIDLDYIFDTLNIDYVSFGGFATGEAAGKGLLSSKPQAFTRFLNVKDLSYNHAVLGDGELYGDFDPATKRIGIRALVSEEKRRVANIDGGIWLGRDSLSFAIDAERVRVGFLQTFMQAFSSHVDGRASGDVLLYGTFKDIDLRGNLFADTIAIKVDYTNVTYSGSDSVIIKPGRIEIPAFRLYDQYGHSAFLDGYLTHRYFHDPSFRFNVTRAGDLLVYDTDARMNPIWYGRIYGNGGGVISGQPGFVGIMADMITCPGSTFTFVLSDEQEALEYKFLTFTDKRKEREEEERRRNLSSDEKSTDDIVAAFNKKVAAQDAAETALYMDIRATVNPDAKLTMVMDPAAGDKITAIGDGAMNMTYSSESNDFRMYGKYTLRQGSYNFSLQDLILRDFTIKPGSSISFNGDPMNGMLDIMAAYRVNTNLTDLDKSFATDRDLNRTNVPVDATLLVKGEMTQPEISFDIEFPTLNDEVTQKVRSIISSEDMMNRQIIYLLALNRFYTPEYMGNTSTGGEWASVASSTLSSQLSNILGQLTDKVDIMPSLRSDKGDFSDLEVDLALSSRLFNNRLLINGNFGYRDRNTSSTTFIGDFDIEYLLHRNGNLRLKAYNHFNDQNYYLKSALTTQGIGIIYRKDFNRLFHRRKKRLALPTTPTPSESPDSASSKESRP